MDIHVYINQYSGLYVNKTNIADETQRSVFFVARIASGNCGYWTVFLLTVDDMRRFFTNILFSSLILTFMA